MKQIAINRLTKKKKFMEELQRIPCDHPGIKGMK